MELSPALIHRLLDSLNCLIRSPFPGFSAHYPLVRFHCLLLSLLTPFNILGLAMFHWSDILVLFIGVFEATDRNIAITSFIGFIVVKLDLSLHKYYI